jgi:hypothetical protein
MTVKTFNSKSQIGPRFGALVESDRCWNSFLVSLVKYRNTACRVLLESQKIVAHSNLDNNRHEINKLGGLKRLVEFISNAPGDSHHLALICLANCLEEGIKCLNKSRMPDILLGPARTADCNSTCWI